ncbi:MAG: hypothetical protein QXQ68_09025 [Candidatus Nitrosocaldaceae archaeon]
MDRTCLAKVITIGRKSGREHKVVLRLVNYNNKYYASRRDLNSDWIKNILANKEAKIVIDNIIIRCAAKMLDDESARVISSMKYDDHRKEMKRFVIELSPLDIINSSE